MAVILIGSIAVAVRRAELKSEGAAAVVTAPAVTASEAGELTITGTAIMDDSSGTPAVPYITYKNEQGKTWTKQLIFADKRGCLPGAGDIPCVPTYNPREPYPQLYSGEHITVQGFIRDNRFLITSLSVGG